MRVMKLSWKALLLVAIWAAAPVACGSDNKGGTGTAGSSGGGTTGSAGTSGGAGTSGSAGTSGNAGTMGSAGRGGTAGGAGTTGSGAATGTQPIGAACANTSNCSQADGTAVCCVQISTCVLDTQCPSGTNYVPCTDTASCNKGGWICCNAGGMHFCTKQSGCPTP